jgi:hypothetical protein
MLTQPANILPLSSELEAIFDVSDATPTKIVLPGPKKPIARGYHSLPANRQANTSSPPPVHTPGDDIFPPTPNQADASPTTTRFDGTAPFVVDAEAPAQHPVATSFPTFTSHPTPGPLSHELPTAIPTELVPSLPHDTYPAPLPELAHAFHQESLPVTTPTTAAVENPAQTFQPAVTHEASHEHDPSVSQELRLPVLFDFEPESDYELRLRAGELVQILAFDSNRLWVQGRTQDGREGWFPTNYIPLPQ